MAKEDSETSREEAIQRALEDLQVAPKKQGKKLVMIGKTWKNRPKISVGDKQLVCNSRFYLYRFVFYWKRYPSNFVTLLWSELGLNIDMKVGFIIPFARRSEMRKLPKHTESLKRMWRRFPGRFQEEIPV